jgi:hypothetical protein
MPSGTGLMARLAPVLKIRDKMFAFKGGEARGAKGQGSE